MLKDLLQKADHKVYTILRHVSRSGMSRVIDVYIVINDLPHCITARVSRLLGYKIDKDCSGLKVSGSGMDMGFDIVHSLSMALYCQTKYSQEGAYKLKQYWL